MSTLYYIVAGGTETELSSAEGSGLFVARNAGAVSTASWQCAVPCDSAPLWPHGTLLSVTRKVNGGAPEILLQGKSFKPEGDGTATAEIMNYTVVDAWFDLEREFYNQSRRIMSAGGDLVSVSYGRVVLAQSDAGARLTAAATVSALVAYAASLGIPLQAGTIDAPVTPPWDELRDRTIAELIQRVLKWQPDAIPWIDHSTVPPTLNVTRRSSMAALSLALTALDACRIRPSPDLQLPGAVVTFELSNDYGDTVEIQEAGDPDALGCARMSIPLEFRPGGRGPVQEIKAPDLGDYTTLAWWQTLFPWLPAGTVIDGATAAPEIPAGYSRVLKAGIITDWMKDELDLGALNVRISCKAKAYTVDGHEVTEKSLSRQFVLTNAESRRYYGLFDGGYAEPAPAGLAAALYAACSTLQYAGRVSLTESECAAARAGLGKVLHVTGGLAAWANMSAVVEQVEERFDTGETTIVVGPQSHLFPQDLIELVRASRLRSSLQPLDRAGAGVPEQPDDVRDPFAPEDIPAETAGQLKGLTLTDPET